MPAEGLHPARKDHGSQRDGQVVLRARGLQDPQPQCRRHQEEKVEETTKQAAPNTPKLDFFPSDFILYIVKFP